MDNVMDLKTVRHAQMIAVRVLLKNIAEIISVTMVKIVIHAVQIALHVLPQNRVEMGSVI